jgi:hypothetical protein
MQRKYKNLSWGAAVLILALIVPPTINVNRYRSRLTASMSEALGRPVTVDSVSLRLLPQPGFDLENLVIGDDPSIGAEPILQAEEVTAALRIGSLWRGRLEIATLKLHYPSLNVTRAADGRINLESLLAQTSQVEAAPTTQHHAEARPRFPYIEATDGRINFKNGLDKSVFSLTDAKFSLWSPSDHEWKMRLEAKPTRTDTTLTDSGVIKGEATFQKGPTPAQTPLVAHLVWQKGQLGQLSKLIEGSDRGWRGEVLASAHFSGTPADLHFTADGSVDDLRRFDINYDDTLTLRLHCQGVATMPTRSLSGFECHAPIGDGAIALGGNLQNEGLQYQMTLQASKLPMSALAAYARHSMRGLPADLKATGTASATVNFHRGGPLPAGRVWSGAATIDGLALSASTLGKPLTLPQLQLAVHTPDDPGPATAKVQKPQVFLNLAPVAVDLDNGKATLAGNLSLEGYDLGLKGPASIERLQQLGRTVALPAPPVALSGKAEADLHLSGRWHNLAEPELAGSAKLSAVKAAVPGIASPVEFSAATVNFAGGRYELTAVSGTAGKLRFTGTGSFPMHCEDDAPCQVESNLHFDELNVDELNTLLNPHLKKQPWYRFFGRSSEESALASLNAHGHIEAARLLLGTQVVTKASASYLLDKSVLQLNDLSAGLLGGTVQGSWTADYSGKAPVYKGSGELHKINAAQLTPLLKQPLGSGSIDTPYTASFSGWTSDEFYNSAKAALNLNWSNGSFKSLSAQHFPQNFALFTARGNYENKTLRFAEGKIASTAGNFTLSGAVSDDLQLNLHFTGEKGGQFDLSGTLAKPQISGSGFPAAPEKPAQKTHRG